MAVVAVELVRPVAGDFIRHAAAGGGVAGVAGSALLGRGAPPVVLAPVVVAF